MLLDSYVFSACQLVPWTHTEDFLEDENGGLVKEMVDCFVRWITFLSDSWVWKGRDCVSWLEILLARYMGF